MIRLRSKSHENSFLSRHRTWSKTFPPLPPPQAPLGPAANAWANGPLTAQKWWSMDLSISPRLVFYFHYFHCFLNLGTQYQDLPMLNSDGSHTWHRSQSPATLSTVHPPRPSKKPRHRAQGRRRPQSCPLCFPPAATSHSSSCTTEVSCWLVATVLPLP